MRKRIKINHLLTLDEGHQFLMNIVNYCQNILPYIIYDIKPIGQQLVLTVWYINDDITKGLMSLTLTLNKNIVPNISQEYVKIKILDLLYGFIYNKSKITFRPDEQQLLIDNIDYLKQFNQPINIYQRLLPYLNGHYKVIVESWIFVERMYERNNPS